MDAAWLLLAMVDPIRQVINYSITLSAWLKWDEKEVER